MKSKNDGQLPASDAKLLNDLHAAKASGTSARTLSDIARDVKRAYDTRSVSRAEGDAACGDDKD